MSRVNWRWLSSEVRYGQGRPQSTLSDSDLLNLRKVWIVSYADPIWLHWTNASQKTLYKAIPVYLAGLTLTKLSILLQYMRLFQGKTIHRIIIGMLIFVAAYGKSIVPFYRYISTKDKALNKTKQEHGPSSAPYSSALPSTTFGTERETPNAWSSKQNGSAMQPWI